jgi:carbon monoxide dehydrogenase subunit G
MKVQLEKTFPMPASADVAWTLLQDIEGVAGCMPGARITERVDPTHYKGTVAVKFGPANLSFRGDVEVKRIEPETRTLRLVGKGTDTTGTSGASMDLTARVDAVDASSCQLVGTSELSVSGKAATFGGRLMGSVGDQVLRQFAENFAAKLGALQVEAPEVQAAAPSAGGTSSSTAGPAEDPEPAPARPLDGPALLWAAIRGWWRALFAGRAH